MDTQAKMSSTYTLRLALFALVFLGFAGWSAYDGFIKYPRINQQVRFFEDYKQQHSDWNTPGSKNYWQDYARANGYPEMPGPAKQGLDLHSQYGMMIITAPIGLLALWSYLRSFGRRITLTDAGLHTSWGVNVPFGDIVLLNKERWRSKGIAIVHYRRDGRERKLVLDDWKFEQQPIGAMVDAVESRLTPAQITGDVKVPTDSTASSSAGEQSPPNA